MTSIDSDDAESSSQGRARQENPDYELMLINEQGDKLRQSEIRRRAAHQTAAVFETELQFLGQWQEELEIRRSRIVQNSVLMASHPDERHGITVGELEDYLKVKELIATTAESSIRVKQRAGYAAFDEYCANHHVLKYITKEKGIVVKDWHAVETTITSVCAVVGAFGAGISYTSIWAAVRGRLDLISWSFTCFIFVVIASAGLQLYHPWKARRFTYVRLDLMLILIFWPGVRIPKELGKIVPAGIIIVYAILLGLPMAAGFVLLGLSLALFDPDQRDILTGSKTAIKVAGFVPCGLLVVLFYVMNVQINSFLVARAKLLWRAMWRIKKDERNQKRERAGNGSSPAVSV